MIATRIPHFSWLSTIVFALGMTGATIGQELQIKATPLSVYLDLRPAVDGAAPQTTPSWIESLEFVPNTVAAPTKFNVEAAPLPPDASENDLANYEARLVKSLSALNRPRSVFRVRLHRPAGGTDYLQARIFFDDRTRDKRPRLSVWNELGHELMRSAPLGEGLGLPSSETLLVPAAGMGYLEVEAAGDGSSVRGIFLTWIAAAPTLQPKDFPSGDLIREPFGVLGEMAAARDDSYLYGVVTAGLQDEEPLTLKPEGSPGLAFQFELEQRPLLAIVTYELLGATVGAPPTISVNEHAQGESDVHLPDLSDPGFRGESEEGKPRMGFRYTGWLRAQKVVSGDALVAGLNNLTLSLSNGSKSIAVRSVSIQLKYNWEKLDYILSPAPVLHEMP